MIYLYLYLLTVCRYYLTVVCSEHADQPAQHQEDADPGGGQAPDAARVRVRRGAAAGLQRVRDGQPQTGRQLQHVASGRGSR